jgi:hypothetical protein
MATGGLQAPRWHPVHCQAPARKRAVASQRACASPSAENKSKISGSSRACGCCGRARHRVNRAVVRRPSKALTGNRAPGRGALSRRAAPRLSSAPSASTGCLSRILRAPPRLALLILVVYNASMLRSLIATFTCAQSISGVLSTSRGEIYRTGPCATGAIPPSRPRWASSWRGTQVAQASAGSAARASAGVSRHAAGARRHARRGGCR